MARDPNVWRKGKENRHGPIEEQPGSMERCNIYCQWKQVTGLVIKGVCDIDGNKRPIVYGRYSLYLIKLLISHFKRVVVKKTKGSSFVTQVDSTMYVSRL